MVKAVVGVCLAALLAAALVLNTPLEFKQDNLTVRAGETYYALIGELQQQHGLSVPALAKLWVKVRNPQTLVPGLVDVSDQPSFVQLVERLGSAKPEEMRLVVIEGVMATDLLNQLSSRQSSIQNTKDAAQDSTEPLTEEVAAKLLGLEESGVEGWFAPDTYFFDTHATNEQILKRLYERQQMLLNEAWEQRAPNLKLSSAYEALILASIIEKETAVESEYELVSGVFHNRLNLGMRLQTDPTVIYGMRHRYNGNISKRDLLEKTAYNTYQIDGLPPTPIALPSQKALWAATHPAQTSALYFVADGSGGHAFSNTYAEHQKAVAQFLQYLRSQRS